MKRSRRWLLICTAVVGLLAHAGALRPQPHFNRAATRTTTTTSTTQAPTTAEAPAEEEVQPNEDPSNGNDTTTKSSLTGIPQIDYIWDPNLPRELNGFNLSTYPFYGTVPPEKEIGFKCEGLHDGFYASIKHRCQLYHHCLYGVRYDFLCANYTAFDQKTFICHFASEVDCKNSDKYFFRNDALYKATTTTSTTTTTTTTVAPPQAAAGAGKRPFRRPLRRRRPVDFYYDEEYDEYYDERPSRRQKNRPRPRRPDFEDDFEDDIYEKRPNNRERSRGGDNEDSGYERRPAERPIERSSERPADRNIDRPKNRNRPTDSRRYNDEEERVPAARKPLKRRRPIDDYEDEDRDTTAAGGRRLNAKDRRPQYPNSGEDSVKYTDESDERRPLGGRRRKGGRRPIIDDEEDDFDERPLKRDPPVDEPPYKERKQESVEVVPVVRSSGPGSIYDRPRVPPRIVPPVPVSERKKYGYSTTKKITTSTSRYDDEYYDDYEDVRPLKKPQKNNKYSDVGGRGRDTKEEREVESPVAVRQDPKTRYETITTDSGTAIHEDTSTKRDRPTGSFRPSSPRDVFKPDEVTRVEPAPGSLKSNNKYNNKESLALENDYTPKYSDPVDYRNRPEPNSEAYKAEPKNNSYKLEENPSSNSKSSSSSSNIPDKRDDPYILEQRNTGYLSDLKNNFNPRSEENNYKTNLKSHSLNSEYRGLSHQHYTNDDKFKSEIRDIIKPEPRETPEKLEIPDNTYNREIARPVVRVIKRPFLPSRGGSPYLPRGLQPVGIAQKSHPTESTPIDMGSTVSAVRFLEHGPPILRGKQDPDDYPPPRNGPRTTQQPQIDQDRVALQKLLESEYDVTLNDALNPTLKPITRGLPNTFTHISSFNNRFSTVNSSPYTYHDSLFSSTDSRRPSIQPPGQSTRTSQSRSEQAYYDYDY